MTFAVALFNTAANFVFGIAYEPLKWLGPFWSLLAISLLAGILMIWIFGKVSNQKAITRSRNRLSAELIGLRLFKDDLRVFFGIQGQVLIWTGKYLRHSFAPMLVLMIPTVIILIQLNYHYGVRPLHVGEQALVKAKLRDPNALAQGMELSLSGPQNVKVETGGVRVESLNEVCWRIRGAAPGRFDLVLSNGQEQLTKAVAVGGRLEGVSPVRAAETSSLLYPGEPPIPSHSAIASIEIVYPRLDLFVFGWRIDWLILFLIFSIGFGYAFKGALGVEV